jgi:hypothetical protein
MRKSRVVTGLLTAALAALAVATASPAASSVGSGNASQSVAKACSTWQYALPEGTLVIAPGDQQFEMQQAGIINATSFDGAYDASGNIYYGASGNYFFVAYGTVQIAGKSYLRCW